MGSLFGKVRKFVVVLHLAHVRNCHRMTGCFRKMTCFYILLYEKGIFIILDIVIHYFFSGAICRHESWCFVSSHVSRFDAWNNMKSCIASSFVRCRYACTQHQTFSRRNPQDLPCGLHRLETMEPMMLYRLGCQTFYRMTGIGWIRM